MTSTPAFQRPMMALFAVLVLIQSLFFLTECFPSGLKGSENKAAEDDVDAHPKQLPKLDPGPFEPHHSEPSAKPSDSVLPPRPPLGVDSVPGGGSERIDESQKKQRDKMMKSRSKRIRVKRDGITQTLQNGGLGARNKRVKREDSATLSPAENNRDSFTYNPCAFDAPLPYEDEYDSYNCSNQMDGLPPLQVRASH